MTAVLTPPIPTVPPATPSPAIPTAADWHRSLGNVPLERILFDSPPGQATEADVIRLVESGKRGIELVNGTLIEKLAGTVESVVITNLIILVGAFVKARKLGLTTGVQGTVCKAIGNIRRPDFAYFRREDFPGGKAPTEPVISVPPSLAVEVIRANGTAAELRVKLDEYFKSGVKVVWSLDPSTQTLRVHDAPDAPDRFRQLTRDDMLDGHADAKGLFPGFRVRIAELFEM